MVWRVSWGNWAWQPWRRCRGRLGLYICRCGFDGSGVLGKAGWRYFCVVEFMVSFRKVWEVLYVVAWDLELELDRKEAKLFCCLCYGWRRLFEYKSMASPACETEGQNLWNNLEPFSTANLLEGIVPFYVYWLDFSMPISQVCSSSWVKPMSGVVVVPSAHVTISNNVAATLSVGSLHTSTQEVRVS